MSASDDESLRALGLILKAWEEGADRGVSAEMMAYAAIYTALTDLVAAFGEDSVAEMARGLVERIDEGEFTLAPVRQ